MGGAYAKNSHCILADTLPPDVIDDAGALTVYAFGLVGSDDDVRERRAIFEDEDGVVFSRLGLLFAYLG